MFALKHKKAFPLPSFNRFKNDIPEFTDELRENYYDELVPTTYLDGANIPLLLRDYMSKPFT